MELGEGSMGLYVDIEKKFPEFNLKVKFESKDGVLGLLGASGSGKSMTLKCIAGLETPDRGKIVLNEKIFYDSGKNINIPIKKRKVGFLFQDYALFPNMTVNQNIGFALDNISKSEKGEIVREKINMMNLTGLSERFPSQLSGGQQQRVAIARALAINPEILLLDEPFSALDSHLRSKMEKEIVGILSTYSGSAVFVSHNRDEIYRICKNIAVIDNGVVDAYGEREEIFSNPPTLSCAKLTGCKNISKIKIIDENTVEALNWRCTIKVKDKIQGYPKYIGVRAHYIEYTYDEYGENTFSCILDSISESPFTVMINLYILEKKSPEKLKCIQWEVNKEFWNKIKNIKQPWNIYINPQKVFMVK